jgi:hypothetical protein
LSRNGKPKQLVEQLQRLGDVVTVLGSRGCDTELGYDGPSRHVDRAVEVRVLGDDPAEQLPVSDVAS